MASIFVSYRRADAAGHAGRLYDQLANRFGAANIFKDLDSMEPGADFAEVIEDTVARCDALIAVIGSDWLSPRLEDPDDWVRLEIAHALARKVRVVPVLVEGAKMPAPADLPEDLSALSRRHAVDLSETGWHAQVSELLDRLESVLPVAPSVPMSDFMENFRTALSDDPPADQGEQAVEPSSEPDGWHVYVQSITKKDRELELCFGENLRYPVEVGARKLLHKVKVDGEQLPIKMDKRGDYTLDGHPGNNIFAPFMLRTPLGESHGVVSLAATFTRLIFVLVYVDGERIYGDVDGEPLSTNPS